MKFQNNPMCFIIFGKVLDSEILNFILHEVSVVENELSKLSTTNIDHLLSRLLQFHFILEGTIYLYSTAWLEL